MGYWVVNASGPLVTSVTSLSSARSSLSDVPTNRRALVGATLAIWAAAWAVLTARSLADGGANIVTSGGVRVLAAGAGAVLCYALHLIMRRLPIRRFRTRLVTGALLAIAAAELFGWMIVGISSLLLPSAAPISLGTIIFTLGFYTWVFFSWITVYLALSYNTLAHDAERRAARADAEAALAQLAVLRYQLNPHFLFNTLNSLSALILERRITEAERMVMGLSEFLRASLTMDPLVLISAREEVEIQRRYLEIEQARFPDLEVSIRVDPEMADVPVPALILQPIVENSVKFAVASSPDQAKVSISARLRRGCLAITVSDNGPPVSIAAEGTGLGLRNVRERLQSMYGEQARLEIERGVHSGFSARIILPLKV